MERLSAEFEAVGFYLSGHPLDQYDRVWQKLGIRRFTEFEALAQRGATAGRLAGIVIAARERRSQKGNKFAFATFSDSTGQFEAVIFSDTLAASRDLLEPGTPVIVTVEAERDGETMKMRVQSLEALDKAAAAMPRNIKLVLDCRKIVGKRGARRDEQQPEAVHTRRRSPAYFAIVRPRSRNGNCTAAPLRALAARTGRFATLPCVTEVVDV